MAAEVTVATGFPRRIVKGNLVEYLYKVDAATTTDYLTTPLKVIKDISMFGSASATLPAGTIAVVSASNPHLRVTLALGAIDAALYIKVAGW